MCEASSCVAKEVSIFSDTAEGRRVQEEIESHLKANQFGEHEIFCIRLALEERDRDEGPFAADLTTFEQAVTSIPSAR